MVGEYYTPLEGYFCHVFFKDGGLGHSLYVDTLANVLHGLAKHGVHEFVHEFKKVFLKVISGSSPQSSVEFNVGLLPGFLFELQYSLDLGEFHSQGEVPFQVPVMKDVLLLIPEVRYQLFHFGGFIAQLILQFLLIASQHLMGDFFFSGARG